jgi:glycosyltransferase involved in cell wall biosynthesis
MGKNKQKQPKYPFISVCTPTFNRRPFIPMMIKCFENQTYPKDKIEWIIIDDGTDKIEDLVLNIPQVKYFKFEDKMTLGKKRNIGNEKCSGEIIIYMDDDDYYPPERFSHAVEMLRQNPKALCAGSSDMLIYFKDIKKMYKFGPYGDKHATAATFAFRKDLLKQTKFDELSCVAEERKFLKDYTIPFVQLESKKSILVFSHNHNSFDKKELLKQMPNPHVLETDIKPDDLIKDTDILNFFMEDIDNLLELYEPGKIENKPDVVEQLIQIKEKREKMMIEEMNKHNQYQDTLQKLHLLQRPKEEQDKINSLTIMIQEITLENNQLKDKVNYLENKIKQLINERMNELINQKKSKC